MPELQTTELVIVVVAFVGVSLLGFFAARWRRAESLDSLDEWGLGGRKFGGWITWFLIGGDIYTAYTFVAVPALIFGAGAAGFFALPYTIIVYPIVFVALARLWSVAHAHGAVTPADVVRLRFGSRTLALAIAITGIVATMPYIALQLVGIEAVLKTMGVGGELPVIIAFVVLAAYTYSSGLRAPALIAVVKDAMIYLVIIVAVIYLPTKLGGWGAIFDAADQKFQASEVKTDGILLGGPGQLQYATLAFGSALALFLYPHSLTGVFAAGSRKAIKRNMAALPAYTIVLGLLALLGYAAIAADVQPVMTDGKPDTNTVVPMLFESQFGDWFAGFAFAAVAIGALVPAAIMSIAAANLFTRNIYREWIKPDATARQEAQVSKISSLVVKFGALAAILFIDPEFSIDLQLIGGVLILQTLPAVALGLFVSFFHRWALLAGWAVGLITGFLMLYNIANPNTGRQHFGGSGFPLEKLGLDTDLIVYAGIPALLVNLVVCVLGTYVLRALKAPDGEDRTRPQDFVRRGSEPRVDDADPARARA